MTDPTDIHHWRRLDGRITTSGQPSEEQLERIRDLGVAWVVNLGLHTHEKALPDEAATVTGLGMAYAHIPVDFQNPTPADLAAFYALMDRLEDQTVHVHCIANFRVSAFLYRYRVDRLGWDRSRARLDVDAIWRPDGPWVALIAD
ncbi:MAG: hypothetical protein JWO72_557 [Caulobacteraceae bacterium]|nr:hypothetical protein [Caulobacteraceae bacterium]